MHHVLYEQIQFCDRMNNQNQRQELPHQPTQQTQQAQPVQQNQPMQPVQLQMQQNPYQQIAMQNPYPAYNQNYPPPPPSNLPIPPAAYTQPQQSARTIYYQNTGQLYCNTCRARTQTIQTRQIGVVTWLWCICIGLWTGCCCLAFFVDSFKDINLVCSRCTNSKKVIEAKCC